MDQRQRQRVLRQHVKTDQLLGLDAVPVAATAPAASTPTVETADRGGAGSTRPGPVSAPPPRRPFVEPTPATQPPPAPEATSPASAASPVRLQPMDRDAKLRILQRMDQDEVRGCTRCPLHAGRTQTVFGEGDPDADILFVGEGPGATEDEQGRPFVGRAGALLDRMIAAMGLDRSDVYIANIVKCRPPNNRTPAPGEVDICWDYLRRQIETIQPRVIVTLGGPAAKILLNTKEGVTRLRGVWHTYNEVDPPIAVMPTFHPAYLLRSYTPENRRRVWSDLQAVMAKLQS